MKKPVLLSFLYLVFLFGFILFFFSGPDYHSSRLYKTIWDQGHIFFYTIFIIILLQNWKVLSSLNIFLQYGFGILLALSTGIPIEFLQVQFSRIPEIGDIWRDILGCLTGFTFFSASMKRLSLNYQWFFKSTVVILILIELWAPAKSLVDETTAIKQFPLLSGFETYFETDRWTADTELKRTQLQVYEGKYAASIVLTTNEYSQLSLKYFPRDWRHYQFLQFAVYNSNTRKLPLVCRINDGEHYQNNQAFHDRYNQKFELTPGWNLIKISLEDISSAPRDRKMNLENIYDFKIFSHFLSESTTIFILIKVD
jgi:hypothetical protein